MSVIIRLQNLPWSANALDIRQYFRGLSIPEGGVHIVGGELGDAFIAFSTDEDARQAFNMNGGKIKEVQIKLLLSSRTEMQKVIEAARNQTAFMQVPAQPPQPLTISTPAVVQKTIAQANCDPVLNKINDNKTDLAKTSDKKIRRSRSRSRERRRDRSRDRSRERKDRRRRDRSRSRERRDRNRDRRDRSRSRNRSRTKDRSRSRERDTSRRGGRDKRKDTDKSSRSQSPTTIDLTVEPTGNNNVNADTNSWDSNSHTGSNFNPMGINNLGGIPPLDMMRKSIPGLMSTAANDTMKFMNAIGGRNDMNFRGRESWPPTNNQDRNNQDRNNQDRNNFRDNSNQPGANFRNDNVDRNFLGAAGSNFGRNMNTFNDQRTPLFGNALNMLNQPRPFLSRPVSMQNSPFSPTVDNNSGSESGKHSDRGNDNYPRDAKQKITPKPGCCVKVRIGRGGYGEVRRFFQGLFIANDGIKLINDDDGVRTGIAYVRFVRSDGKADALLRNGHLNRGCPVEVLHLDDNEFDEAIDSYRPPYSKDRDSSNDRENDRRPPKSQTPFNDKKNEKYSCMSISNLPPYTKEHDIITMIGDYPLVSIMMVMGRENRQLAYVQFNRSDDAYKVYTMDEKHEIHGKSVMVRLVSEDVFHEAKRQHNTGSGIVDVPDDFVNTTRSQNKPTSPGNCFPRDNIVSNCVVLKGLPYKTSDRDIIDFFSDIGLVPTRIHVPLEKFNRQRSDSFCEFATPDEAVRALAKNGVPLGMSDVTVELVARREMEQILGVPPQGSDPGRFQSGPRFGGPVAGGPNPTRHLPSLLGPGPRGMPPGGPIPNADIPESFRKPGCVISLENVPFRAGVDEILDFFHEFDIPEANVLRRYNDKGNPTGDARVAFNSPAEAMRALNKLRHCKIRDRTIFMYMT